MTTLWLKIWGCAPCAWISISSLAQNFVCFLSAFWTSQHWLNICIGYNWPPESLKSVFPFIVDGFAFFMTAGSPMLSERALFSSGLGMWVMFYMKISQLNLRTVLLRVVRTSGAVISVILQTCECMRWQHETNVWPCCSDVAAFCSSFFWDTACFSSVLRLMVSLRFCAGVLLSGCGSAIGYCGDISRGTECGWDKEEFEGFQHQVTFYKWCLMWWVYI